MTLPTEAELRALSPAAKRQVRDELRMVRALARVKHTERYPWQVRPVDHLEAQHAWLAMGGRGTGKSQIGAMHLVEHVTGPPCDPDVPGGHRLLIVAPTVGDAVESCVTGPSGLAAYLPGITPVTRAGGTFVTFPNGAVARLTGAHTKGDLENLRSRAGNRCCVWLEEYAAMRYAQEAIDQVRLGLRMGTRPHLVITTTPKPRKAVRALVDDARVHVTRGRTRDAIHLDEAVRRELVNQYAGTRLEAQELDGELLDEVEGALADYDLLDSIRISGDEVPDHLGRVVVAIDPAVTAKASSDETGLVVAGVDYRPRRHVGYVLADHSGKRLPRGRDGWPAVALRLLHQHDGDAIVAEVNNGGDLVEEAIRNASTEVLNDDGTTTRLTGENVRVVTVNATRGKQVRAEPCVLAMEQRRWMHADVAASVRRDQWATWVPTDDDSPDRVDAEVWAFTHLLGDDRSGTVSSPTGTRQAAAAAKSATPLTERRVSRQH